MVKHVSTILGHVAGILFGALLVKYLWNYAAVDTLHVSRLDYPHALCLNWLCSLLFRTYPNVSKQQK